MVQLNIKSQQVSQSALCRAVQDGFLLSDLPDLPSVVTSQINSQDPGKYLPELPNFMQYYTWCHAHDVRARRPRIVCTSSACHLCMRICCLHQDTSSAHCLQAICTTPHGHCGPELSFTVTGICY